MKTIMVKNAVKIRYNIVFQLSFYFFYFIGFWATGFVGIVSAKSCGTPQYEIIDSRK